MRRAVLAVLSLLAASGIAVAAPPPGQAGAAWAEDWSAKQLEPTLALFATDAVFVQPDGARVEGLPAIRTLFQTVLAANDPSIVLHSLAAGSAGTAGFEAGRYDETIRPAAGGPPVSYHGHYFLRLRREADGNWRIIELAWTE